MTVAAEHLHSSLHSGTENVPGIVGIAKATELIYQNFDADIEHLKSIGLYDDNGNVYGSKWFYMEIPNEDLQIINDLLDDQKESD